MIATIALGQMNATDVLADNLEKISLFAKRASMEGADLLALPEYAMGYPAVKDGAFPAAETLDGLFIKELRLLAKKYQIYLLCGILEHVAGMKPYNTLVLIDRNGSIVCTHRKNHMYQTSRYIESDYFSMGDEPFFAVNTDFGRIGLVNCYEVRFPELVRLQALAGAEIILVCAGFVEGPHKREQWHTLLAARAIENAVYVCGCDHIKPKVFVGESAAYNPEGALMGKLNTEEDILLISCDLDALQEIRQTNTSLVNRRNDLCGLKLEDEPTI